MTAGGSRRRHLLSLGILTVLPLGASSVSAQSYPVDPLSVPRPTITATRVDGPIVVDGLLDEQAWSQAVATTETWIQTVPDPFFLSHCSFPAAATARAAPTCSSKSRIPIIS